ncbi:MAG: acetyltransferase [Pseudomonadota bacterium]
MSAQPTRIRSNRPDDAVRIVEIWCTSVDATHDFLSAEDRASIEALVAEHIPKAELDLLVDEEDPPLAFLKMDGPMIDALFVAGDRLGEGLGSVLLRYALEDHGATTLEVNEQNPQAVAFYKRWGFEVTDRMETDDHGRPYPTLTMTLKE